MNIGRDKGEQGILRIRRRAFQGGSRIGVFAGSLFLAMLIVVNYWNLMAPSIVDSLPLLVFSIFMAFVVGGLILRELDRMRPQVVTIGPDKITCIMSKRKRLDIPWGPEVHVDVEVDKWYRSRAFGPLVGFDVYIPHEIGIAVHAEDGWKISDVRQAWRLILKLIKQKELKMDEDLIEHINNRVEWRRIEN